MQTLLLDEWFGKRCDGRFGLDRRRLYTKVHWEIRQRDAYPRRAYWVLVADSNFEMIPQGPHLVFRRL